MRIGIINIQYSAFLSVDKKWISINLKAGADIVPIKSLNLVESTIGRKMRSKFLNHKLEMMMSNTRCNDMQRIRIKNLLLKQQIMHTALSSCKHYGETRGPNFLRPQAKNTAYFCAVAG
ncbi:hypothetical protein ACW4YW_07725 [Methylobacillus pratensis]